MSHVVKNQPFKYLGSVAELRDDFLGDLLSFRMGIILVSFQMYEMVFCCTE